MMAKVLSADFLKIRRKMIWALVLIAPAGVVALQALNFGLRYDYLTKLYADDLWQGVMTNVQLMGASALLLGIAILASMLAGVEHHTNAWKQLLALPVSRWSVFAAKFALCAILLLASCALLAAGTVALGVALGFGWDFSVVALAKTAFYPFIASMPLLALQLWLSVTMHNQAIPLTIGIAGTVLSMFAFRFPDWFIWKWPLLENDALKPEYSVMAGAIVGAVLFVLGSVDFARRDVK